MHPILFKLGPITVFSYGAMVALGFAIAVALVYRRAGRFGIDKNKAVDLFILILVSGIVGGRLFYVLLNLKIYAANPLAVFNLSEGGLVWYGAFLLGLASAAAYMRVNRMRFWDTMDMASPYIALGQAFGRIGCFLNGCCYGLGRHPVQLYSSAALFLIFMILRLWRGRRRFEGEIFLGYLLLYSLKRLLVEFLRGDNPRIFLNLTLSQILSVPIFLIALALFARKAAGWRKSTSG
jgi:phosphatidylglycerol:prolipoprotein diacylglycerol transferase